MSLLPWRTSDGASLFIGPLRFVRLSLEGPVFSMIWSKLVKPRIHCASRKSLR